MKKYKLLAKQAIILPLRFLDLLAEIYIFSLSKIRPNFSYLWVDLQGKKIARRLKIVMHTAGFQSNLLKFYTPNYLCEIRAATFSTKEPETLDWIDKNGGTGAFFDIGANVGLYSIYFAKTKLGNVYSFEPSVFNLALLVKNVNLNGVDKKVKLVSTPLTDQISFADFALSSIQEGGALSAFGVDYGSDGKLLTKVSSYQTLGFSLDFLFDCGALKEYPEIIKIDVDGIEHLILRGAKKTISHPSCKTILVEVTNDFSFQKKEIHKILSECGFILSNAVSEFTSDIFEVGTINQIWHKNSFL
jgi:FkbM family methyltransferase